jgi:hypothetical protein
MNDLPGFWGSVIISADYLIPSPAVFVTFGQKLAALVTRLAFVTRRLRKKPVPRPRLTVATPSEAMVCKIKSWLSQMI